MQNFRNILLVSEVNYHKFLELKIKRQTTRVTAS